MDGSRTKDMSFNLGSLLIKSFIHCLWGHFWQHRSPRTTWQRGFLRAVTCICRTCRFSRISAIGSSWMDFNWPLILPEGCFGWETLMCCDLRNWCRLLQNFVNEFFGFQTSQYLVSVSSSLQLAENSLWDAENERQKCSQKLMFWLDSSLTQTPVIHTSLPNQHHL